MAYATQEALHKMIENEERRQRVLQKQIDKSKQMVIKHHAELEKDIAKHGDLIPTGCPEAVKLDNAA